MMAPMSPANFSVHFWTLSCLAAQAASLDSSTSCPVMRRFSAKSSGHSSRQAEAETGAGSSSGRDRR
eukprot:scaffold32866_cov101-Isochrysis_galbana.AAC.4